MDKIIEILERKYGSPETLLAFVSSVINNMERLAGPAKGYPNLNLFYREVMTVQDALESIDEVDRNVHFVDQIVRQKLPLETGREWLKFKGANVGTITVFGKFLEDLLEEVEQLSRYEFEKEIRAPGGLPKVDKSGRSRILLQEEVDPATANASAPPTIRCPFGCMQGHRAKDCPQFLEAPIADRWRLVKEHRRCAGCLVNHYITMGPSLT